MLNDTVINQLLEGAENTESIDPYVCQRCSAHGANHKGLLMSCRTNVSSVVPEAIKVRPNTFLFNLCNACMLEYMEVLQRWFERSAKS